MDRGLTFIWLVKSQIIKYYVQAELLIYLLLRNQIMVPCKSLVSFTFPPDKHFSSISRGGMYLNWNKSRRNTTSTAHAHTCTYIYCLSAGVVAWVQDRGTHDLVVHHHRALHLSQTSFCRHKLFSHCTKPQNIHYIDTKQHQITFDMMVLSNILF